MRVRRNKNREADSKTSTPAKPSSYRRFNYLDTDSHDTITHLQRTIGNQAIQRLMRSNIRFDFAKIGIQQKLKVSEPGDSFEQEANRVAEHVMRRSDSHSITSAVPNKVEARNCEVEEKKMQISRKQSDGANHEVSNETPNEINNLRSSSSSPVDSSTREFMESSFGFDFSRVRIHTSDTSARLANSLNAYAFTVGNNIVFGQGQYNPNTIEGKKLLAHELTHVVQQTALDERQVSDNDEIATHSSISKPAVEGIAPLGFVQRQGYMFPRDKEKLKKFLEEEQEKTQLHKDKVDNPQSLPTHPATPEDQIRKFYYDKALELFSGPTGSASIFIDHWATWVAIAISDITEPKEAPENWWIALAGNFFWAVAGILQPELVATTLILSLAGATVATVGPSLPEPIGYSFNGKELLTSRVAEVADKLEKGVQPFGVSPLTRFAAERCVELGMFSK
ncbi:MAG: DUF4157 domain-containing protein, partial [Candidatus Nitrosopolaris sp.]